MRAFIWIHKEFHNFGEMIITLHIILNASVENNNKKISMFKVSGVYPSKAGDIHG